MVNPLSPEPLYIQVANAIAERIASGELKPNTPIASESTLQDEYAVSRGTVRQAMAALRERGLVFTIAQRGTYVTNQSGPVTDG